MTQYNAADDVIYFASCAVNGTAPDKERIGAADLDEVYRLASRHSVGSAVAYAVESAGAKDARSAQAIAAAVRKTAVFDKEWNAIKSEFAEAGIVFAPLKGAVLKNDYPKYGMREFSDYDILIDPERADEVRAIMEGLGYTAEKFDVGVHDVYHKEPFLNFEIHRALFDRRHDALGEYYKNVSDRLRGDGCEKSFSPEDFYLYQIAHEYKHFSGGGTGLRSLLDVYVCLKKPLDMEYVAAEAEKMGIADFEKNNRSLALHLVGGEELTGSEQAMLDYVVTSGTFGTVSHSIENKMRKNGRSKIRYALGRFFVPFRKKNPYYDFFAGVYPFFYRHKIFLPFLPFYRAVNSIKKGNFRKELKALKKAGK